MYQHCLFYAVLVLLLQYIISITESYNTCKLFGSRFGSRHTCIDTSSLWLLL